MVIYRTGPPLSPVYKKVNQKLKYVKFINKINKFTINKALFLLSRFWFYNDFGEASKLIKEVLV